MDEETHQRNQLFRRSRRLGMNFHIEIQQNDNIMLISNNNRMNDAREATPEESEMWKALFPDPLRSDETLDLITNQSISGPFTFYLNNQDFCVIREHGRGRLEINTHIPTLKEGHMGDYKDQPIYVKRCVPKGYFIRHMGIMKNIDDLHDGEVESLLEPFHI